MVTFLKLVGRLGAKGAKWAWANKTKVLNMLSRGFTVEYMIKFISEKV